MAIPEQAHRRIHGGTGRGGLWNEAWRQFMEAHRGQPLTQEQLLGKSLEFAFRFNIAGPLMPYGHTIVPPGPQLLAP